METNQLPRYWRRKIVPRLIGWSFYGVYLGDDLPLHADPVIIEGWRITYWRASKAAVEWIKLIDAEPKDFWLPGASDGDPA